FRGHGQSRGFFTWTAKEHLDLEAVVDLIRPKYHKVGVIAFSLGAAIAINTIGETAPVDSLIAVSAPSSFWRIDYQVWRMGIKENIIYNLFQEGRIGKGVRPGWLWHK